MKWVTCVLVLLFNMKAILKIMERAIFLQYWALFGHRKMMSVKVRRLSETFNSCVQSVTESMFGLVDDCILCHLCWRSLSNISPHSFLLPVGICGSKCFPFKMFCLFPVFRIMSKKKKIIFYSNIKTAVQYKTRPN